LPISDLIIYGADSWSSIPPTLFVETVSVGPAGFIASVVAINEHEEYWAPLSQAERRDIKVELKY
jgi:hypothetical protein